MKKRKRSESNKDYGRLIYLKIRISVVLTIILLLIAFLYFFLENYKITDVSVEGNSHYTAEQIKEMVMKDRFSDNSVFLSLRYRKKSITGVPFIEKMDVSIVDKHTVKITVYEKALAGYVEFLGSYMYFDKDGIVVESSNVITPGIPQVTGLSFDHIVLHEPLPVEDDDVFKEILNMTQLLNKYGITADRMYFGVSGEKTLYFGNVKVQIGDESEIDQKIMRLPYILPSLEGKSGTLHMENYSESSKDTTFESNDL